jgi:hypothetical protein
MECTEKGIISKKVNKQYCSTYRKSYKNNLEELNQALGNRDKMKEDDAIAQLSDQVMALTARMQEIERKQQPYVP